MIGDAGLEGERRASSQVQQNCLKVQILSVCTARVQEVHRHPDWLTFKDTRVDNSLVLQCKAVCVYVSLKGAGEM